MNSQIVWFTGGFAFNSDETTMYRFSTMVSTSDNRSKFIKSVVSYLQRYALNGVDIGMSCALFPVTGSEEDLPTRG